MEGLKIVAGDTAGKGAMSLADTPSLAPERLKRKFDELSLDVLVPAHNALVTVLERDYASLTDVANTVFETGSADMTKAQYDANLNGTVDDSEKLAGKPSSYYASAANAFGNYAHSLALSLDIPAGTTYYKDLADLTKTGTTSQVASRISVSGQETVDGVKYYKLTLDGVATAIRTDAAGTKLYRTHKLSGAGDNVRFVAEGSFCEGDALEINEAAHTARTIDGEMLQDNYFITGAAVSCHLNKREGTSYANFKQGGAALNFKIKSYATEAALSADTPVENTIGIVTAVPITEWVFSSMQPTTKLNGAALSGGEVWFKTNTASPSVFNALRKNCMMAYPGSCCQYSGSAWEIRTAKTRQAGLWRRWDVGYYVRGALSLGESLFSVTPTASIKYGDSGICVESGGVFGFDTAIDLTKYHTLSVRVTRLTSIDVVRYCTAALSKTQNRGSMYADFTGLSLTGGTLTTATTECNWTYDLSAVNGLYYLGFILDMAVFRIDYALLT